MNAQDLTVWPGHSSRWIWLALALSCTACAEQKTVRESDGSLPSTEGHSLGGGSEHDAHSPERIGVRVADYMIATWPELDREPSDCTGPENCFSMAFGTVPAGPAPKFWEYTYGVPIYGIQKLYELTRNKEYLDYVKKYVDRYVADDGTIDYGRSWPLTAEGALPSANDPTIQDVIQPSNLLFGLYDETKDDRYRQALDNTHAIFPRIMRNPEGAFWHKPSYPNQQWLDGIYMSQPLLVHYGSAFASDSDGAAAYAMAIEQIKLAAEHTHDPETDLYFHAWNGAPDGVWQGLALPSKVPPQSRVSPILWARSLAWFITGIVDVLEYLPKQHSERAELVKIVENIAKGLERFQDPDTGLYYQVVDVMDQPLPDNGGYPGEQERPAQPNWLETSSSALFAYSLSKAVRLEILAPKYDALAEKAWSGVKTKIELASDGAVMIRDTVVGMSVGGTFNAYTNADFRSDLTSGEPPAATSCPTAADIPAGTTPAISCKYVYVRDNVPQAFGAVLLAASELEYP